MPYYPQRNQHGYPELEINQCPVNEPIINLGVCPPQPVYSTGPWNFNPTAFGFPPDVVIAIPHKPDIVYCSTCESKGFREWGGRWVIKLIKIFLIIQFFNK